MTARVGAHDTRKRETLYKAAVAYETYQLEAGATAPMKSVGKEDRRDDGQWRRQRLMAVAKGHQASAESRLSPPAASMVEAAGSFAGAGQMYIHTTLRRPT